MAERKDRGEQILSRCNFACEARERLIRNDLPVANCQHPKCNVVFYSNGKWRGVAYCSKLNQEIEKLDKLIEARSGKSPEDIINRLRRKLTELRSEAEKIGIAP